MVCIYLCIINSMLINVVDYFLIMIIGFVKQLKGYTKENNHMPIAKEFRAIPCFGRHVKPLVPAAFAVVSTHQPALGPRGGLWPVLLMCDP
jgi:hypothetical protein